MAGLSRDTNSKTTFTENENRITDLSALGVWTPSNVLYGFRITRVGYPCSENHFEYFESGKIWIVTQRKIF